MSWFMLLLLLYRVYWLSHHFASFLICGQSHWRFINKLSIISEIYWELRSRVSMGFILHINKWFSLHKSCLALHFGCCHMASSFLARHAGGVIAHAFQYGRAKSKKKLDINGRQFWPEHCRKQSAKQGSTNSNRKSSTMPAMQRSSVGWQLVSIIKSGTYLQYMPCAYKRKKQPATRCGC